MRTCNRLMNVSKKTIEKVLVRCKKQWVKWLVGALVGALAAAGVLTVTGCTLSVDPAVVRYVLENPVDKTGK